MSPTVSPDVFLSRHQIPTDNVAGLPGSPAEQVTNLKILNSTRTWDPINEEFIYTVYETPDFKAVPGDENPNQFSPKLVKLETQLLNHYNEVVKSGNLALVHSAADSINRLRMIKGGAEFFPLTDFDILAESKVSSIGLAARRLNECMEVFADSDLDTESVFATDFHGDMRCRLGAWWGTKECFDALNEYEIPTE